MSHYVAESLLGTTLSIFGMRGQLSEALRIINCLSALARVFMIEDSLQQAAGNALAFAVQQNETDVPEMLTEPGKWINGDTLLSIDLLTILACLLS